MGRAGHTQRAGVVTLPRDQPHRLVDAADDRSDGGLSGVADPDLGGIASARAAIRAPLNVRSNYLSVLFRETRHPPDGVDGLGVPDHSVRRMHVQQ